MFKIKTLASKSWIFVSAAVIIVGSSSAMAFTLNNNVPESASANIAPSTAAIKENIQTQASKAAITANYTIVDRSKSWLDDEQKKVLKDKLSNIKGKGITPQQIEEKYNEIISNMIPGEKDMSAEQAAAYAVAILQKAYGVDLTGYTAEATFSRNLVPNSDNWEVIFHAPQETESTKRYYVSVDSVDGTMLNAGCYTLDYTEENSKDLGNTNWKDKAAQEISKLMPENVSITDSKVVCTVPLKGAMVVCELSDGSAYAVNIAGENKEAIAYQYFPDGYDGSWDYHPVTADGVG